jgi:hypothetical protein
VSVAALMNDNYEKLAERIVKDVLELVDWLEKRR